MPIRLNNLLIVFFILFVNITFSQEQNPTDYPYGGVPDSNRVLQVIGNDTIEIPIPLNFKMANFYDAKFDSSVYFAWARFDSLVDFSEARFDSLAFFWFAQFYSRADFKKAQFHNLADFAGAQFDSLVNFEGAQFDSQAYFGPAQLDGLANFEGAQFYSRANFEKAQFHNRAFFGGAQFYSRANFKKVQFHNRAFFGGAQFDSLVDFRGAQFDSAAVADFRIGIILDSVYVGSIVKIQRFDFSLTILLPGAKIIIDNPVEIKIQHEKFHFISLPKELDYFDKKVIVDGTKKESFRGDDYAKERFELDYIFAKSTMYQNKSTRYIENRWYQVWKYPKWLLSTLYYLTMGLGYRPFRLAWWVLGLIISFAIFYFFKMRESINGYILKKFEIKESSGIKRKKDVSAISHISRTESLMNCFYFSSMLLFSFRLKGEILTFFGLKEKRIIFGEYLLGLLIYIAFLTLAKSGSILHNLKSLFVG